MFIKKFPELNAEIQNRISSVTNAGMRNHLYGVYMEESIVKLLQRQEGICILHELGLTFSDIRGIICGSELSSYTKDNKIDILILTSSGNIGISCKATNNSMVGVLEMKGKTFSEKIRKFSERNNLNSLEENIHFFEFFNENNCCKTNCEKTDIEKCHNFVSSIENDWKTYLKFCIQGENSEVNYLFFYDKVSHYLYVSNIDEYINLIEENGTPATFHTRMSLTRTSGKAEKRIKFKMQNPIKILKKTNNLIDC